jgi:hypothetical protein
VHAESAVSLASLGRKEDLYLQILQADQEQISARQDKYP